MFDKKQKDTQEGQSGPEPQKAGKAPGQKTGNDMEQLGKERDDYKEKYLRLYAEFENARKRMDREKVEFVKYANEGLMREFLEILDNLERSVEAAKAKHQDYTAFLKGIEMVMAHIYDMLKKNNVRPIETQGKRFDPEMHEPLMQEESDEKDEWTILEEFQKGYMFGDRVLRTSKVKVAVKSGQPAASTDNEVAGSAETPPHNQDNNDSERNEKDS